MNVIKKNQIVERSTDLKKFFTNIQPELYYIVCEMRKHDVKSFCPCIDDSGEVSAFIDGTTYKIKKDGTPVRVNEEVLGIPFQGDK